MHPDRQDPGLLCLDGVGEWATTSFGSGAAIASSCTADPLSALARPALFGLHLLHRLPGQLRRVQGDGPRAVRRAELAERILENFIDLKADGSFRLDMRYFNYATGLTMTNDHFDRLFGGPPASPRVRLTQREMDLAASIQTVTEEVMLRLARTVHRELGTEYLCLAGGVALNCVANGRILREGPFVTSGSNPRPATPAVRSGRRSRYGTNIMTARAGRREGDSMYGSYLGPSFSDSEIESSLNAVGARYQRLADSDLMRQVAGIIAAENVVGWFQGRMEFGPRALGARSIIGDARSPKMQSVMNLKIKYRESFRPFAPAVLADRVADYFELDRPSPYMLLVAPVREELRTPMSSGQQSLFGIEKLNVPRSTIPAVTHIDYSARIQTIHHETNPRFYELLKACDALSGCAVLVNTSFNVRGEPIVCTPEDAYRCFMRTEMDYLVVGNYLLAKADQPPVPRDDSWKKEFELD